MAGCARGGGKPQIQDRKYNVIRTIDAIVLNTNAPNISIQNGDTVHSSSERQVIDYRHEAAPEKPTSHSSTAQMDVPHTTVLPAGAAGRQFLNVVLSTCWMCSWLGS